MSPASKKSNIGKLASEGLWQNNPIYCQVLGICSTLAVTNLVLNTIVMCVGLVFTTALSSMTVSLLRSFTPRNIRMMVEVLIIAFYVIIIDVLLKAYWPEMSGNLGPYVGLIITNCIVMGRCEACGNSNPPVMAFFDGMFNGLGYSFILLIIATVREILGMGTFLGFGVPYFSTPYWDKWIIMVMPPGAFFMLGLIVWLFRTIALPKESK
ncbi:MAG: Rnf-Nqr domain containing protein [Sedimentisphaerales bacterium]